jgi:lysophospholipase L1-like esterase
MGRLRALVYWLALLAIAGSFGVFTSITMSREIGQSETPDGWKRQSRYQPFVSAKDRGKQVPMSYGWALSAYQSLFTEAPAKRLKLRAELPPQSEMFVSLGMAQPLAGAGILFKPGQKPIAQRVIPDGPPIPLRCTGELPVTPATGFPAHFERTATGFSVEQNRNKLSCDAQIGPSGPAIQSGLRRISVSKVRVDGSDVGASLDGRPGWWAFFGVLMLGVLERLLGMGCLVSLLSWAPLALGGPLTKIDSDWVAEALRVPHNTEGMFVLGTLLGACALLKSVAVGAHIAKRNPPPHTAHAALVVGTVCVALALAQGPVPLAQAVAFALVALGVGEAMLRWMLPRAKAPSGGAITIVIGAAVGAVLTWAIGTTQTMGALYGVLGGLSLGALVWLQIQGRQVRFYNTISLLLAAAILGCGEVVVRFSPVGPMWNAVDTQRGAGALETLIQQFDDLAKAEHRDYPAEGFTVAPPPRTAPVRVVCLGASSTGGAFQNDDLNDFFPARLNALLGPDVQVINQGVGGWTSFHVRLFVAQHLDSLDADVITIYLGVNEKLPTPVSFAELYKRWQTGDLSTPWTGLNRVRLFQGLRLMARGLKPGAGVGVVPEEMVENLRAITAAAQARGIRTLLMSEGVRPDPGIIGAYFDGMITVAGDGPDVAYLDTATTLQTVGAKAFIDGNHLTNTGHEAVAKAAAAELKRLGWL